MDTIALTLLNGLSYGLLLFMLSSGLTLIFSMMGVLNFAHASFYMLGAYLGQALAARLGFGTALWLAPLAVGGLGAAFEHLCLRRVHRHGHVAELLVTFGAAYVIVEAVQLVWGRGPLEFHPPDWLAGPAFTRVRDAAGASWVAGAAEACAAAGTSCTPFPATRVFMMGVALAMLAALAALLALTRVGMVIRAALTHPRMVEALGHDLPKVYMGVFGAGAALAALAGVIGGSTFVTEPGMAAAVGSVVFVVVVVGGVGSLGGAFAASVLIGLLQTAAVGFDRPLFGRPSLAQLAPALPFALLVAVLAWRPAGLFAPRRG